MTSGNEKDPDEVQQGVNEVIFNEDRKLFTFFLAL